MRRCPCLPVYSTLSYLAMPVCLGKSFGRSLVEWSAGGGRSGGYASLLPSLSYPFSFCLSCCLDTGLPLMGAVLRMGASLPECLCLSGAHYWAMRMYRPIEAWGIGPMGLGTLGAESGQGG